MDTPDRREFLCSMVTAAVIAMMPGCASPASLGDAGPGRKEVLDGIKIAVAGKTREEVLAELDDKSGHYLGLSGNCAQSSFLALRDVFNLPDAGLSRALTGFPGLGLRGETCGTVSGSMVAVGLAYGREDLNDGPGMVRAAIACSDICESVKAVSGSTQCGDILEIATGRRFNFYTEEGFAAYAASSGPAACYTALLAATHTAAELLLQAVA